MMTKMEWTRLGVAALTAASLVAMGCEQPDWDNPEYVAEQVREDDPITQRQAIDRVSQLPEEKQKEVIPALVEVYKGAGPNQKEAMRLLVQYRDPAAKDAYLAELESDATEYAHSAATALGEIGAKDAVPKMLEVLASTDKDDVKLGIIQAFGHMPTAEMVPPLLEILKLDVDTNPIQLHAYTCEVLGNLAQKNKEAITPETLHQITQAVFYGNLKGQSLDRECGLAIQQIGEPAVPELIKIFKGEREDVQKLMMRYDTGENAQFPQNTPQLISAKRLTSLRAEEAIDAFHEELTSKKEAPENLKGQKAVAWRKKEGMITSEVILGLGDLGAEKSVEFLREVVEGEHINDDLWTDITDYTVELQFRQDAGFALNRIGDRESIDTLLEVAEDGVIADLEKLAARAESGGNPMPAKARYQLNWMSLRTAAMLSDGSDQKKFDDLIQSTSKEYPDLGKQMAKFAPVVKLAAECNAKGDDAAKAKCYGAKLKDNKPEIREKAAWELGRLPAEAARPVILANLGNDFLDTREVLVFDLYRMPDAAAIKRIDEILADEEGKGGPDYRLDHYRLKLLRAYLINKTA
jgi:HEAT repeat protein